MELQSTFQTINSLIPTDDEEGGGREGEGGELRATARRAPRRLIMLIAFVSFLLFIAATIEVVIAFFTSLVDNQAFMDHLTEIVSSSSRKKCLEDVSSNK